MKNKERNLKLLLKCISYIKLEDSNYLEMIKTFKSLGFTNKELLQFNIRDLDIEKDLDYNEIIKNQ